MNFCEILGGVMSWDGKQSVRFWIYILIVIAERYVKVLQLQCDCCT